MKPEQAAIDRIEAVASSGGDTLDLGDLPLKCLPNELVALKTLRVLILGAGRYVADRGVAMLRKEGPRVERPLTNLAGLDRLTTLRHLDLSKLADVTAVPEVNALKSLESLNLSGCTNLSSLPELQKLPQLTALNLHGCKSLDSLPGIENLTQLRMLYLHGLTSLTALPELKKLTQLTILSLQGHSGLTALPSLEKHTYLAELSLYDFARLMTLPELGKLTRLTSLNLHGLTGLTALPGLEKLTQLTSLNLHRLTGLTALPGLEKLTQLTTLSLFGLAGLTALPGLEKLTQLKSLNMHALMGLTALPGLEKLTQLTSLSLFGLTRLTALPGLEKLAQLTLLALEGATVLTALPGLEKLTQLTSLNLHGLTRLIALPKLETLTQLTSLNLQSPTRQAALPGLEKLTQLTSLTLRGQTGLAALPELAKLTQLTSLKLQGLSGLVALPELAKLTQLTSLGLQGPSGLTALPELEKLDKLTTIDVSGCTELASIASLASLRALEVLRAQGCRALEALPIFGSDGSLARVNLEACGSLGTFAPLRSQLTTLSELNLDGTYFSDLPAELCGSNSGDNVLPAVRAHFAARNQQGDHEDRECKLLILGNGRVGKTSLARQLLGQPHDPVERSTHGIQLWTWEPATQLQGDTEPSPIRVNIWDFGGQDLYHNTHRLFISSRSIFVLVWEAASASQSSGYMDDDPLDKKRPLRYWLDQVHSIHRDPQIVIVRTKIDLASGAPAADWRDEVPEKYRDVPSIEVSSASRSTSVTESLQCLITVAIGQELGLQKNRLIGEGRWRVKARLRQLQAENDLLIRDNKQPSCPTLTMEQFREIVSRECANTDDASDPQWLLRYLHDTGVIYYRKDLFSDLVIVEQRWMIDAIYTIFEPGACRDHLLQTRGRFRLSQLNDWAAWSKKGFTEEQQRLMVWFMYSCRICFLLLEVEESAYGEAIFVATHYLPKRRVVEDDIAELVRPFGNEPVASVAAEHLFLGESLMGGFLARLGNLYSRSARFWKNGAAFVASGEKVAATVEWMPHSDSSFGGKLRIQTFGDETGGASVVAQIWNTFRFQPSFPEGLRWTREIWPTVSDLDFEVGAVDSDRQLETPLRSDCVRSGKVGISRASERKGSGSAYNEAGIDRLPEALHRALKSGSGTRLPCEVLIDDGDHDFPTIPAFMDELAKGDFVFVFLSKKYLHSKYCCYELWSIYKASPASNPFPKERVKLLRYPSGRLSDNTSKAELNSYWETEANRFNVDLKQHETNPLEMMNIAEGMEYCLRWFQFSNVPSNRWALIGAIGKSPWESLAQPIPGNPTADELRGIEELVGTWVLEVDTKLSEKSSARE